MTSGFGQLMVRWLVLALGVMLASAIVPGIDYGDGGTLLLVALLLSFLNAVLKPLLVLFTLPFIFVTMGLGMIVINAFLFLLAGRLVHGFHVAGFWSAVGGALVVSFTNLVAGAFRGRGPPAPPPPGPPPQRGPDPRPPAVDGDVIDI
jgi:putative membrane protein